MESGGEVTALDILTLCIAILGLVLSVVALVWQVLAWRLTGPVVKVQTQKMKLIGAGSIANQPVVRIEARNVGRSAVSVTAWALEVEGGSLYLTPQPVPWQGPPVPHSLPGGHSATWYSMEEEVQRTMRKSGDTRTVVRGRVSLGTGKEVKSEESVVVETEPASESSS